MSRKLKNKNKNDEEVCECYLLIKTMNSHKNTPNFTNYKKCVWTPDSSRPDMGQHVKNHHLASL